MAEKTKPAEWQRPEKKEEGEIGINHEKIAHEIWDKIANGEYFNVEKGFLIGIIDKIYEKGKADQKAKKKGKK